MLEIVALQPTGDGEMVCPVMTGQFYQKSKSVPKYLSGSQIEDCRR